MKNLGVIIAITIIISLLCATVIAETYPSIPIINNGIWQVINGDTITQNDTNLNVNIGENLTTIFQLNVDGDTNINGVLYALGISTPNLLITGDLDVSNNITANWVDANIKHYNDLILTSTVGNILIHSKNLNITQKDLNFTGNITALKNISTHKNFNLFGLLGSRFYIDYDDSAISSYVRLVSPSGIELNADNGNGIIKLSGSLNLPTNKSLTFGNGNIDTGGLPNYGIFYNGLTKSLDFLSNKAPGVSPILSNYYTFNPTLKNTDFIINGDTVSKVFNLDASLDKINITKVNITGLLTVPCIVNGSSLTAYQIKGSVILNTTTNILASYNGVNWHWYKQPVGVTQNITVVTVITPPATATLHYVNGILVSVT